MQLKIQTNLQIEVRRLPEVAVDITSKLRKEGLTDKTWKGLTEVITKSDKCL
jgi:hypothetical protein